MQGSVIHLSNNIESIRILIFIIRDMVGQFLVDNY
jgi:hypothetical protein